ncbi:hypothetical protein RUND412_000085 [Rhizina undulata]
MSNNINGSTSNDRTGGLHTLVEGLTIFPNSPVTSPSSASVSSLTSGPPPSFDPSSSSIFNNPSTLAPASSSAVASSENTISNPSSSFSNASARLQSFGARRLNYSGPRGTTGGGSGGGGLPTEISTNGTTDGNGADTGADNDESAVKEVDDPTTPNTSIFDKNGPNTFVRLFATPTQQGSDSVKLEDFLYTRGFLEGACSDVTIVAFNIRYRLHRLILDRSPFFSSCFNGGPWLESTSSEITLSPEISDPNITQHAFELALSRLYGHLDRAEEDRHALPLLAAASYLDLQDLAESCVSSLLRNLKTSNISTIVRFVTNSYYGHLTDRLLESAKALLYRDGWEMKLSEWDGISGDVAAEIVGYDGFYVPSEWDRYQFVKEMVDWRIQHSYAENSEMSQETALGIEGGDEGDAVSTIDEYDPDVKPLIDLLENGIYYVHMSFEELQKIREDINILGRPTVSEYTIMRALWQQTSLRKKVLNAPLNGAELGITDMEVVRQPTPTGNKSPERQATPRLNQKSSQSGAVPSTPPPQSAGMDDRGGTLSAIASRSGKRKYYIPTEDTTTVIGDCPDHSQHVVVSQPSARGTVASRPTEQSTESSGDDKDSMTPPVPEELRYSEFPPFRFSAEFRNVRTLKEKKRVYSKTVFYAGSHWNIYIQKVRSSKNVQLGVYLHRAKDRETSGGNGVNSGSGVRDGEGVNQVITVDERVGHVERDLHTRNNNDIGEDYTMTTVDGDVTAASFAGNVAGRPGANTSASRSVPGGSGDVGAGVSALPHYVDARPMIQTYFKIFSPSRKGKMLSMFSSGPDSFNFSQSWGWKSSSLILEEGLINEVDKDARLRFMVVLGNV